MSTEASDSAKAVDARVVGVVQRKGGLLKPQQHSYVVDVSWSDGSHTDIWRSYKEFFHFQCDLLAAFPEEASEKCPESRTIPFLPGRKVMSRSTKRLAESRQQGIDGYVQALLRLPKKIVDSSLVQRFFHHKPTDPVRVISGDTGTIVVKQGGGTHKGDQQELEGSSVKATSDRDSPVTGIRAPSGDQNQSTSSTNGDSNLEENRIEENMDCEIQQEREEIKEETDDPVSQ